MYWTPGPDFVQGQTMSALAHLNPLTDAINFLAGAEVGPRLPFVGKEIFYNAGGSHRYSEWVIRHESNSFQYEYEAIAGTCRITIDGTLVPGSENATGDVQTTYSATVDISSIGLTIGERYIVRFEMTAAYGLSCKARLWLMREVITPAYTTLAAFTDGLLPTAVEWQALSTVANEIHALQAHPQSTFAGNLDDWHESPPVVGRWIGTFRHTARYLTYHMWLRPPFWGSEAINTESHYMWILGVSTLIGPSPVDGGAHWIDAQFYIIDADDTAIPVLTISKEIELNVDVKWWEFEGTIDLSTLGLTYGQDYKVRVDFVTSSIDLYHAGRLEYILEAPGNTPALTGWQALNQWTHGDSVLGDSGSLNTVKMRTDLEILKTLAAYENYPTPRSRTVVIDGEPRTFTWGVRKHKWLHYCSSKADSPTLTLWQEPDADDPNVKTTSLAASYVDDEKPEWETEDWYERTLGLDWQLLDLDSVKGCFLGSIYALNGVLYAFEDDSPPNETL